MMIVTVMLHSYFDYVDFVEPFQPDGTIVTTEWKGKKGKMGDRNGLERESGTQRNPVLMPPKNASTEFYL